MATTTLNTTRALSRARVFRTTPHRPLTHLTMGFAEIAAWKAARRLASPDDTTMLHSAITGPAFPRRGEHDPAPPSPNAERSASEIHDVPSLNVLGKLYPAAPTAAPVPKKTRSSHDKTTVPKSTLASGLEALRRLGQGLSRRAAKTDTPPAGASSAATMVGGVPLEGDVVATTTAGSGEKDKKEAAAKEHHEFPRELPMFLGGGLY